MEALLESLLCAAREVEFGVEECAVLSGAIARVSPLVERSAQSKEKWSPECLRLLRMCVDGFVAQYHSLVQEEHMLLAGSGDRNALRSQVDVWSKLRSTLCSFLKTAVCGVLQPNADPESDEVLLLVLQLWGEVLVSFNMVQSTPDDLEVRMPYPFPTILQADTSDLHALVLAMDSTDHGASVSGLMMNECTVSLLRCRILHAYTKHLCAHRWIGPLLDVVLEVVAQEFSQDTLSSARNQLMVATIFAAEGLNSPQPESAGLTTSWWLFPLLSQTVGPAFITGFLELGFAWGPFWRKVLVEYLSCERDGAPITADALASESVSFSISSCLPSAQSFVGEDIVIPIPYEMLSIVVDMIVFLSPSYFKVALQHVRDNEVACNYLLPALLFHLDYECLAAVYARGDSDVEWHIAQGLVRAVSYIWTNALNRKCRRVLQYSKEPNLALMEEFIGHALNPTLRDRHQLTSLADKPDLFRCWLYFMVLLVDPSCSPLTKDATEPVPEVPIFARSAVEHLFMSGMAGRFPVSSEVMVTCTQLAAVLKPSSSALSFCQQLCVLSCTRNPNVIAQSFSSMLTMVSTTRRSDQMAFAVHVMSNTLKQAVVSLPLLIEDSVKIIASSPSSAQENGGESFLWTLEALEREAGIANRTSEKGAIYLYSMLLHLCLESLSSCERLSDIDELVVAKRCRSALEALSASTASCAEWLPSTQRLRTYSLRLACVSAARSDVNNHFVPILRSLSSQCGEFAKVVLTAVSDVLLCTSVHNIAEPHLQNKLADELAAIGVHGDESGMRNRLLLLLGVAVGQCTKFSRRTREQIADCLGTYWDVACCGQEIMPTIEEYSNSLPQAPSTRSMKLARDMLSKCFDVVLTVFRLVARLHPPSTECMFQVMMAIMVLATSHWHAHSHASHAMERSWALPTLLALTGALWTMPPLDECAAVIDALHRTRSGDNRVISAILVEVVRFVLRYRPRRRSFVFDAKTARWTRIVDSEDLYGTVFAIRRIIFAAGKPARQILGNRLGPESRLPSS